MAPVEKLTSDGGKTFVDHVVATEEELAAAFTEWLRRYHEEPERFADEYPDDEEDYGTGCAAYFVKLLGELS